MNEIVSTENKWAVIAGDDVVFYVDEDLESAADDAANYGGILIRREEVPALIQQLTDGFGL